MKFFALIHILLFASCSPSLVKVKPWERGNLAKPIMDPSKDALATSVAGHLYFSREAASGGSGIGGGGCGCN